MMLILLKNVLAKYAFLKIVKGRMKVEQNGEFK
jgi:hypothetical protein